MNANLEIAMSQVDMLYDKLRKRENFSLARFNDGELAGIIKPGITVARGDQLVNEDLQGKLYESLIYESTEYYKGIPCPNCFPHFYHVANQITEGHRNKLPAVVFTNENLQRTVREFKVSLDNRPWLWISGEDQEITKLPFYNKNNDIKYLTVENKNSSRFYDQLTTSELLDHFQEDQVVFVSLGPIARPLVKFYHKITRADNKYPEVTIIDIGSTFDNYTRNVWLNCHKGTVAYCKFCNRREL